MPEGIRNQYKYFTEAKMDKLAETGCPLSFREMEDSIRDYVAGHLQTPDPYL
jgi:ADP-L-glycero-D-manno-heptose 6-epimerase